MSFLVGVLSGVFALFIGSIGLSMLKWIGAIAYFGNWLFYVAAIFVLVLGVIGYSVGSSYARDNEGDFVYGIKKLLKRHPLLRLLLSLFLLGATGYLTYHIWLYCNSKYPPKIAILITVVGVLFNLIYLSSFAKLWRSLVSNEGNSAGIATVSAIALIVMLGLDYSYLLAPALGWTPLSKIGAVSKPVVSHLAPDVSPKPVASVVKQQVKKKKPKKKSVKKKNSSTTAAATEIAPTYNEF